MKRFKARSLRLAIGMVGFVVFLLALFSAIAAGDISNEGMGIGVTGLVMFLALVVWDWEK